MNPRPRNPSDSGFIGPNVRQVTLEQKILQGTVHLAPDVANLEVQIRQPETARGQLVLHLRARCWSEGFDEGREYVEFTRPRTWWDHLKQTLGWRWLGKVRLHTERKLFQFRRRATYPSLPLCAIGDGHAYAVINTVLPLPQCYDAEVGKCDSLELILLNLHSARNQAWKQMGAEPVRMATSRRTWFGMVRHIQKAGVLEFAPDVKTKVQSKFEGLAVTFDEMVPEGIVRFVCC